MLENFEGWIIKYLNVRIIKYLKVRWRMLRYCIFVFDIDNVVFYFGYGDLGIVNVIVLFWFFSVL